MNFCDLPDDVRMRFRGVVEGAGGLVEGYHGPCLQVACPNPWGPFNTAMEAAGLTLVEGSLYAFPLGSDSPPESLRHDGSYPGSKGFWLYARYQPRQGGDS
jgi:hypothetical protein